MKFNIALCQIGTEKDKQINRQRAERSVTGAADAGARIVALPEMWNCPYDNAFFRPYGEPADGETVQFMSELAKRHRIYLVGGSIPELADGNVYNTSFIFNPQGEVIGRHRKAHMFDIDVENGIRFMESETLTPGDEVTVVDTEFCRIGVAICFDVRFPELTRRMALDGARLVILPAAFNMTTGPAHWELSMRARALDNQLYFAACGPARNENASYVAWGHSMVCDPWGRVISETEEKEDIVFAEIDTEFVDSVRRQLPLLQNRRPELY
ncbi:MAG: carbon-nitrogen hydrolase family protein [Anaerovoracaceae bacterium]|jgi:omega-amidase